MLKEYFVVVNELAQTKQAALAGELAAYKRANETSMEDKIEAAKEVLRRAEESGDVEVHSIDDLLKNRKAKKAADAAPAAAPNAALAAGKEYAPALGYGAGAGALAGIPIALLANAFFGKDKSLRGHLRSALMGAILGGGAGAVGGGALKYLHGHGYGDKIDSGIDTLSGLAGKGLGAMGLDALDAYQGERGPSLRSRTAGNAIKGILG